MKQTTRKTVENAYERYSKLRKRKGLSYRTKKLTFSQFKKKYDVYEAFDYENTKSRAAFNTKVIKKLVTDEWTTVRATKAQYKTLSDKGYANADSYREFKEYYVKEHPAELKEILSKEASALNIELKAQGLTGTERAKTIGQDLFGSL